MRGGWSGGGFNGAFVMSQCLGVCPPINIAFFVRSTAGEGGAEEVPHLASAEATLLIQLAGCGTFFRSLSHPTRIW